MDVEYVGRDKKLTQTNSSNIVFFKFDCRKLQIDTVHSEFIIQNKQWILY